MFHRDGGLGRWWPIAQSAVWSHGVVVAAPSSDQDLRLSQRIENLAVEQLVAEPCVEAFDVAVLPRRSRLDIRRSGSDSFDPLSDLDGDELRPVVRPDLRRRAAQDEQIGQCINGVDGVELALYSDHENLSGMFVDDGDHAVGAPIRCPVLSWTKPKDQTWFGRSGLIRTQDPSTARQGIALQCPERGPARADRVSSVSAAP